MKRKGSGDDSSSDHSDSFTPPLYYAQPPQPLQETEFFFGAKTVADATTIAATTQPMYAFPPIAPSLNAIAMPPIVLPVPTTASTSNGGNGMDDMDHWLVDICAQLGSADDDNATQLGTGGGCGSNVRLPDAARCYDASSPPSTEFRPVYPATSSTATPLAFAPAASFVPTPMYASSSGSSPGSSSVESGSDAKPLTMTYTSNSNSNINAPRPARRAAATNSRTKRPVATATAAAMGSLSSSQQLPVGTASTTQLAQSTLTPAETRREKNRLRVRRHYYRKLSQMNDLRAQVSELEDTITSLQLEQNSTTGITGTIGSQATTLLLSNSSNASDQLQSHVAQLERTKRALTAENQHVRTLLVTQTQQLMRARQMGQQQLMVTVRPENPQLLGAFMPPPFVVKRRLVPTDCDRIWQRTTRDLRGLECCRALATSGGPNTNNTGNNNSICGWTVTRAVDDGAFKFVFQKRLRNCPALATRDAAWQIFRDPQAFAKLYSPSVNMWCALVQTVDDNNVVLYQEHKSMDKDQVHVVMKTVLLASRIQGVGGRTFGITLRGVDHALLELEDLSVSSTDNEGYEVWNDVNCWLEWLPRGDSDCELKVAGAIPTVGSNAYFWMVEVLLIVMRLEAATTASSSSANLFNVSQ